MSEVTLYFKDKMCVNMLSLICKCKSIHKHSVARASFCCGAGFSTILSTRLGRNMPSQDHRAMCVLSRRERAEQDNNTHRPLGGSMLLGIALP